MPDTQEEIWLFSYREVAEELIKKQGLHEGRWKLIFELGMVAHNLNVKKEDSVVATPTGSILIQRIGLARTEETNNLTLDASEVNPPAKTRKSTKRPSKKGAK